MSSPDKAHYRHLLSELLFEAAHLADEGELESVDELVEWVRHQLHQRGQPLIDDNPGLVQ